MPPLVRYTLPGLVLSHVPARAEDILASYHARSGSLPPDHARSIEAAISPAGQVSVTRCTGYETSGPACTSRTGTADAARIEALGQAVRDSGLLEKPAKKAPADAIPIGGGSTDGSITLDGQTVLLPAFPQAGDADRVARVLAAITAAIPAQLIEGN